MEPKVTPSPDFSKLAQAARWSGKPEAIEELWRAAYELENWFFVARGEMPNVTPFMAVFPEGPFVTAFTSEAVAHEFAIKRGLMHASGAIPILSMTVEGAVRSLPSLAASGAAGVIFNPGTDGFFAPFANLVPIWEHVKGTKLA